MELYSTTKSDINIGAFPLNHDCILKVEYIPEFPLRFEYFTCRAQDSGRIVLILSQLHCVKKVVCINVDNF